MMQYEIPDDLLYAKTHEWARVDNLDVTLGITSYAVEQMDKEIVNIELPEKGRIVAKGESFGVVDSVKAAFDLYSPVNGEVTAVNKSILNQPEMVANAPYTEGWMIKIRMSNAHDLDDLMKSEKYKTFLESEEH
jgi:glycine cleavage system H protein